ncbi:MAG TPA: hypothetical protein VHK88_01160 [Aquihabitans sp.]|jgi:hypothetical protein|nr:hypothetical protein [Aquihabitans sp.]
MGFPTGRLTVECECGVRLDVIRLDDRFGSVTGGHLPRLTRGTRGSPPGAYEVNRILQYGGRHLDPKFTGWRSEEYETSVTYKCRRCGRSWAIKLDRFQEVAKRRLENGGRRLVAGADF